MFFCPLMVDPDLVTGGDGPRPQGDLVLALYQLVTGSDASQFRPGLTVNDKLMVFVGDIFQSRDLVVHSKTELHGVKLLRYWLVGRMLMMFICSTCDAS